VTRFVSCTWWIASGLAMAACGNARTVPVCADGSGLYATIGEAIAGEPSGATIELCPGTYAETLAITGTSFTLRGESADTTILDAGGAGTAITVVDGGLTIDGLTIRNAVAPQRGGGIACSNSGVTLIDAAVTDNRAAGGGGIGAENCDVRVSDSRFERNEGGENGGALYLLTSSGAIGGSTFSGNAADNGGAIAIVGAPVDVSRNELRGNTGRAHGGALFVSADATIADNVIAGNASQWTGGGLYVDQHAPTLRGNTIEENTAVEEGGGAYFHQSQAVIEDNLVRANRSEDDGGGFRLFESRARLERNRFEGNVASMGEGGAYKISHLPSTFVDNELVGNEAYGAGGGAEHDNDSSIVRGGLVANNHASIGGGMHVMRWPWNDGLIEKVLIVDNRSWLGGGIYVEDGFQPATLRNLTITGNEADRGGGLWASGGYIVMRNSLVAANTASHEGGGIYLVPSEPWTEECPCPPVDPPTDLAFVVLHGNAAPEGAALWTSAPNVTVDSSIVSGGDVRVAPLGSAPAWHYNDVYPAAYSGMLDPTGRDGNLSTEPQFHAPGDGDYRLAAASACVDAGNPEYRDPDGSRADMGLHAGPEAP
jgi:nitrous oxidase accessory protein NosD